ncbi:unnamed protein product [Chironomus riparius]|uniref:Uncharacterized protein n=2 Tax=Chironomus riparius TaxID=315576 RepID=A0A9P0ISF2_9DIPT|nr:unnamed protein product [Chironomus riparius]
MQMSFNDSLKFFLEKEKVYSEMDMELDDKGHKVMKNGNGRKRHQFIPCISKELYDEPPQSDFIVIQMFYNILHTTFIVLSKLRLGQVIISVLDYYMIKIENTLDFCLPDNCEFAAQKVIDKHKKTLPIQDRPMSWLFFIPALIFLRIFRFVLSIYGILAGVGEITARQMQAKVIAFRRYYRSIRHYAVNAWTAQDKEMIENRKAWIWWRLYYRVYESIFMTKFIVEIHQHKAALEVGNGKPNGHGKRSLDISSSDIDDDLNTNEMLEKYANAEDSLVADPDYEPNESGNLDTTLDSIDSDNDEDEKTNIEEFQGECSANVQEYSSMMANVEHSSDVASSEQSENDKSSPPEHAFIEDAEAHNNEQSNQVADDQSEKVSYEENNCTS